jgi:hypothetical protein
MTPSESRTGYGARCFGVLVIGLGLGCGGASSNGKTGSKSDGGQTGSIAGAGSLSAVIDGVAWSSVANETTVSSSSASPGQLTITGTEGSPTNYTSLSFGLGFIAGPGTYPLGVNQGSTPGGTGTVLSIASTTTFNDWAIDLAYPSTFTLPSGDNTGNTMSATLNGQPWYAATVEGVGDASTGVLSLDGMTTGISLSITTSAPVAAGGTYDQSAITMLATGMGANCCWVGTGGTISVTITSLTAARAAGTFTATLPVSAGGTATAPLTITDGKFDLLISPAS